MNPVLLLVAHIALYSSLPFAFAVLEDPLRLILFYVYVAAVVTVGGFLGSVYSIPLNDTIVLSGGALAYGALMMAALLLVIVERDVAVLRTIILIVVTVNIFRFLLFSVVSWTMTASAVGNPFGTSPDVFATSARFVIVRGALMIVELLAIVVILERIKSRLVNLRLMALACAALYVVILALDGVVITLVALPGEPALVDIAADAPSKLVMALAYSVPLLAFLVLFRDRLAAYRLTPIGLRNPFLARREDLVGEIKRQQGLVGSSEERYRSAVASAKVVSERGERLVESANDAIVSIDRDSRITSWNARAQELFGWAREEAIGAPLTELAIPDRWREAHREAIARIVTAGEPVPITRHPTGLTGLHRAGHEVPIELSIAHEQTNEGWVFTGFLRDQAGEAAARDDLRNELERRELVATSLARIRPSGTPEQIALSICDQIAETLDLELVFVEEVVGRGRKASVVPLAYNGHVGERAFPIAVGRPLPQSRARTLLERARAGPWVSDLSTEELTPYVQTWVSAGLRSAAYIPIGDRGDPVALLIAGSGSLDVDRPARLLPDLLSYAAIAAAYLGPALADRRALGQARKSMRGIIRQAAFRPVFQPIVDLRLDTTVGWEGLTRFTDGRSPDLVFAEAASAGLGQALELATLVRTLGAADGLPPDAFLSVNVSPELILSGKLAEALPSWREQIVLEVTEHVEIHDYAAVRAAVDALGPVRLAVDDAGAGFASLRHIIELEPAFMKLDISLVRRIETDPARQALVAGMVYFAERTDRTLIAEGVETEAERATLVSLGVELGQGYLLGRPGPVAGR
jgi:PAS domain S-box-containing protein